MSIQVKRVYDSPASTDGFRVLADRLWPRGISKSTARIDLWIRDLSPSNELRKWYGHDPDKWPGFKRRYFEELKLNDYTFSELAALVSKRRVTLLFGSKELRLNNAYALKEALEARLPTDSKKPN